MTRSRGSFKFKLFSVFLISVMLLCGCGSDFASPYKGSVLASEMAGRGFLADLKADSFASDLCVVTGDVPVPGLEMANSVESVLLVDISNAEVMASVGATRQIHPASTTKLMTALLALENCSMDEKLTLGSEVTGFAYDETVLPGKVGDTMTMDQALHLCLCIRQMISRILSLSMSGAILHISAR